MPRATWSDRAAGRRGRRVTGTDVRRFLTALCGPQRVSVLRAVVDGIIVRRTLQRRGLRPLVRDMSGRSANPDAREVAAAVDAGLGVLPVAPTCLRRSVTLLRELDRRQIGGTLHIGVRQGPAGIEAHAWVQSGDDVLNDDPVLVRTYSEISAGAAERLLPGLE